MSEFDKRSYTPEKAMRKIGSGFWVRYREDLLVYAKDRTRADVPEKIHGDWDGLFHWPCGTDKRIEWAVALYEHGDWPDADGSGEKTVPAIVDKAPTGASPSRAQSDEAVRSPSPKPGVGVRVPKAPAAVVKAEPAVKRKCSNCLYSKNPDRCGHGMFGPCEDWVEATEPEEHWPTWEDMKRAEHEDYRSRYRDL